MIKFSNIPPADWLRKTVIRLFFFFGGRQTTTARYRNTRTLSQLGTELYWLELNWIFVINTVSNRLATIRARLIEKKMSAGNNNSEGSIHSPLGDVLYANHYPGFQSWL